MSCHAEMNNMKNRILKLLKESDSYISGQRLCDEFQVSRTAVWKVIEKLKKEGYEIDSVRNRGYRLIGTPDVLSEAEIMSLMETTWAGKKVVYYDEIDSTNNRAKDAGEHGGEHGTLFVADMQSAGKGRRGRAWISPSGSSIYMTILLRPEVTPNEAPMLTLVMGLSIAEGIRQATGADVKIKWPNDIVIGGKKICGILTEMATEEDYINYVVIGIGINVNQQDFAEDIKDKATSLRIELGENCKRAKIVAQTMKRFEENYETFMQTRDLSGLQEAYNDILVNCGREVKILEPGNAYEAMAEGIDRTGQLLVTLPDGEKKEIYAGEVSVRGLHGYI